VEFLVHIAIDLPPTMEAVEQARLRHAEQVRGRELQAAGLLTRIWRDPGRAANWSIYSVPDASALHEALSSLPLWPWMRIEVHPLARHPLES
jgi:muconolactone D-isomerase